MARILLIFDDYTELTTMELNLKKIGFDVIGISSEFSLSQELLSFNPDLVVANGSSSRVNGINIAKKLKDNTRWNGKTIVIFQTNSRPSADDLLRMRVDAVLEYPLTFKQILSTVAQLLNMQANTLIDRWNKVRTSEANGDDAQYNAGPNEGDSSVFVTGSIDSKDLAEEISGLEHKELTKDIGTKNWNRDLDDYNARKKRPMPNMQDLAKKTGFDIKKALHKRDAKLANKKNKADWSDKDLEEQDKLRQKFTQALFKKDRS